MRAWILLADAASARLYASAGRPGDWTLLREFAHPESRMRPSELLSDKPGRVKQSAGSRAAMEPGPKYSRCGLPQSGQRTVIIPGLNQMQYFGLAAKT
jgi:hypothetical protein